MTDGGREKDCLATAAGLLDHGDFAPWNVECHYSILSL